LFLDVVEKTSNRIQAIKNIWDEFKIVKLQFIRSCGIAKDNLKYVSLIMEHYKVFILMYIKWLYIMLSVDFIRLARLGTIETKNNDFSYLVILL